MKAGGHEVRLYRSDVLYRYRYGGVEYHSNQYSHTDFRTPSYAGKRRIAREVAARQGLVCYVYPADPAEAVLTRAPGVSLAWSAFSLAFVGVGLANAIKNRPALWRAAAPPGASGAGDWKSRAWLATAGVVGVMLVVAAADT